MKLLLNYEYSLYPFTTASYLEMAAKKDENITLMHVGDEKKTKPDLIINVMPFDEVFTISGVKSCYWEIDCHMIQGQKNYLYDQVDKVYIAQEPFLRFYPFGKTAYLPLACDPDNHKRISGQRELYDIGFIGNDSYPERRKLLDVLDANFKLLRTTSAPGIPYSTLLSQCRLTFNRSMLQDVNMRFFEAIACGRLLLTDYLPDQDYFADEGVHYAAYEGAQDLVKKVKYYLENEKIREDMAERGAEHMRREHTYAKRLYSILEDFGWNAF